MILFNPNNTHSTSKFGIPFGCLNSLQIANQIYKALEKFFHRGNLVH